LTQFRPGKSPIPTRNRPNLDCFQRTVPYSLRIRPPNTASVPQPTHSSPHPAPAAPGYNRGLDPNAIRGTNARSTSHHPGSRAKAA
jgi:hypothetical protein